MRPTWRLLGALGLGAVVYFLGLSSGVAWLFLVSYGVWAIALVAYPYARWSDRRLSGSVEVSGSHGPAAPLALLPRRLAESGPLPGPLFEGDDLSLALELRASAACGPALLSGRVAGTEIRAGTGRVTAGGWRAGARLDHVGRGPLVAEEVHLVTGDPLGLFRRRRRVDDREIAVAHPLFASLSDPPPAAEADSEAAAARAGAGLEFAGVREYRPGDSTRRIHWRSSARRGRLVVREFEPPAARTVVVLVDPAPPSREAADQVARIAASEVWDCVRLGGRAALWAPGLRGAGPAGAASMWALLDWLARYPRLPVGDGAPPAAAIVVAVACSRASPVLGHLDAGRLGAREIRTWLVAERPDDLGPDPDSRVVGTTWPLA